MSVYPPTVVQLAFRCQGQPVPLPGGQGEAFRCGDIVLTPCRDTVEASWVDQLHLDIQQAGFRLPQPVRTTDGEWIVDGWQAWTVVEGEHSRERWREVIETCRVFHRAVGDIAEPPFLEMRDDPFSRADRIAWGEERADCHPHVVAVIERLQSVVEPFDLPNQVIHGDFTENLLFKEGLPPAVIDISPYWRPAEYAQAIVVVDALDWCGADESILQWVEDVPDILQLMVRAEIYRVAIYDGLYKQGVDTLEATNGHIQTVDMLTQRLS
ncbi:MAG: TIGR02569 family protein [Chloroflexia bacterium]|nr:TIGR02569 family protein [Chloroflexia bacterium]